MHAIHKVPVKSMYKYIKQNCIGVNLRNLGVVDFSCGPTYISIKSNG